MSRIGNEPIIIPEGVTVIHEGDLSTLKHHQQEVNEVKEGSECGIALANYEDIKEDDIIECFDVKTELPKL